MAVRSTAGAGVPVCSTARAGVRGKRDNVCGENETTLVRGALPHVEIGVLREEGRTLVRGALPHVDIGVLREEGRGGGDHATGLSELCVVM